MGYNLVQFPWKSQIILKSNTLRKMEASSCPLVIQIFCWVSGLLCYSVGLIGGLI